MKQALLGAAALVAIATVAYAQSPAANAIHARQANYKQIAAATKGINDQLRGGAPDIGAIRRASALLANYSGQIPRWFPRGTGAEAGVTTRARPEIWSDWAGFHRAAAGFYVAARTLNAAAQGGDVAAIRAAMPAVSHACSNCHDDYRAPEH